MTIFDRIVRQLAYECNGRIYTTSGCWVFQVPKNYPKDAHLLKGTDATGKPMFCIGKKGVFCPNPDVGENTYPQSKDSRIWFVPHSVCRKCQHYCKTGSNRLRYPHCDWVRSRRGGNAGAVINTARVYIDVLDFADRMIGRR